MTYRAVIFDLGGVVFPSPIAVLRSYEAEVGLPPRFLSQEMTADDEAGAWSRMERGELTVSEFIPAFESECALAGRPVNATEIMRRIAGSLGPRPEMLRAIDVIRSAGLRAAALTNNWHESRDELDHPLEGHFDLVVESAREGLRKPDPRIYTLVCERLAVEPPDCVFLDDLGVNLKPARAMGMFTIKVAEPAPAISELGAVLDLSL